MTLARVLAASALVLTAAALDSLSAARALGLLLLLLLCGALPAWHWASRPLPPPADCSSHDSKPGMIGAAGTYITHCMV